MELLTVKNLTFTYPLREKSAIEDLSFSVEKGDFVAVCGSTGSGKSTLMRMLKKELRPNGTLSGEVLSENISLEDFDEKESARKIGYVMQRPEQQTVTDKVWHELAFGLENLGEKNDVIRRRVSEMACYFGIEDWFEKNVSDLSGGQKQLLNLASVMVMQPEILILDEPTSQLDPIAASDFIATVAKLNRELSLTVIIVEHRLEEVIPVSNKVLALEDGKLLFYGKTREICEKIGKYPSVLNGMPAAVRIHGMLSSDKECPLTVREGHNFIEANYDNRMKSLEKSPYKHETAVALEFSDAFFRYERKLPDVLKGLNLKVYQNEIFCLLGGNGSGKSTTLSIAAGINKLYSGSVRVFGKKVSDYKDRSLYQNMLAFLPQDVQTIFLKNTVREELESAKCDISSLPFDVSSLLSRHPYDLSGGQQQLVALAEVLASKPEILLLDEPTKGLDCNAKNKIAAILRKLRENGTTVVIVTHDVDFAAEIADRCALFFRGEITSCDEPNAFFSDNTFYSTAANRMTRGIYDGAVTVSDVVELCKQNGGKR